MVSATLRAKEPQHLRVAHGKARQVKQCINHETLLLVYHGATG